MPETNDYPTITLKENFRYLHCRYPPELRAGIKIDNYLADQVNELASYIRHSAHGGTFLVTGYRGTGKSCFVQEVIKKLEPSQSDTHDLISVWLNLATTFETDNILHQIIRGFYQKVRENKQINNNNGYKDVIDHISRAYQRITFKMGFNTEETKKKSYGAEIGASVWTWLSGKIQANGSDEEKLASSFEYLDYDKKAAEDDLFKLVELFENKNANDNANHKNFYPIVVLDELDKLEQSNDEQTDEKRVKLFDATLKKLKNLFSSSGLFFIVVAGIEFYEDWLRDRSGENSLYDSIFTKNFYIPRNWTIGNEIVDAFTKQTSGVDQQQIADFLNYKSRGGLNKALQEFYCVGTCDNNSSNKIVRKFEPDDMSKIEFYSGLQEVVKKSWEKISKSFAIRNYLFDDKSKDAIYTVTNSILQILSHVNKFSEQKLKEGVIQEELLDESNSLILPEILFALERKYISKSENGIRTITPEYTKTIKEIIQREELIRSEKVLKIVNDIITLQKEEDQRELKDLEDFEKKLDQAIFTNDNERIENAEIFQDSVYDKLKEIYRAKKKYPDDKYILPIAKILVLKAKYIEAKELCDFVITQKKIPQVLKENAQNLLNEITSSPEESDA